MEKKKLTAKIFATERHRIETDGKGIRSLVAFLGCPLRCRYCLNPISWDNSTPTMIYSPEKLLQEVSVDSIYFQATGGGITFGGGEPLLNAAFISRFIDIAPRTWTFAVETSLAVPLENLRLIADKIQYFIVDIKSMDEDIYRTYTGGELSLAKNNLIFLVNTIGTNNLIVRVPRIPEYADFRSQDFSVSELKKLGITQINTFSYKTN